MTKCPLCNSNETLLLETIAGKDLIKIYESNFKTDIRNLIHSDINYYECRKCTLRYFDPLVTGDEKFYNSLQDYDWYYVANKPEFEIASKYIEKNSKVLEVGSGAGNFAKYISGKYVGLDFSKKAKELAAKNGITIENIMIQDYAKNHVDEFDTIVSFQVLEHVSNPKEFIASALLALKSGGRLIISVPNEDSFFKDIHNEVLNMPPHHVTRWGIDVFKNLEKMFPLNLLKVENENLRKAHKKFYFSSMIVKKIMTPKMIDMSLERKIFWKFANILGAFLSNIIPNQNKITGHSFVVVLEKK